MVGMTHTEADICDVDAVAAAIAKPAHRLDRSGFIDAEQLLQIAASLKSTYYGRYLETVTHEARHQY
jgi:dTDP-glucose pyrophosphorylase